MAIATAGSHAGSPPTQLTCLSHWLFRGYQAFGRLKFQVGFLHELLTEPADNLSLLALPSWWLTDRTPTVVTPLRIFDWLRGTRYQYGYLS
jgi:hypothetical protein